MKYLRYTIRTTSEAEDLVISAMSDLGLEGAQIEDHVPLTAAEKEQIYTYDADDPVDDGMACVSFYAAITADGRLSLSGDPEEHEEEALREADVLEHEIRDLLRELKDRTDIGEGTLDICIMDDAAWKDRWKQFFHSFRIDDILITPSWEAESTPATTPDEPAGSAEDMTVAVKDADRTPRYTLRIDPGTAFGTGAHETTQLAIRALRMEIEERLRHMADSETLCANQAAAQPAPSVLDIGTGSGILSILSLMFGADFAVGTDLDVFTKEATAQNLAANGIDPARFHLVIGNLIDDEAVRKEVNRLSEGYDLIVANILPVVLKPLTPVIPSLLKPDGVYICSGILTEKEEEMRGVLENAGFEIRNVSYRGEWCSFVSALKV